MATVARLEANRRYREKAYDSITLSVKKGKKDEWKQAAEIRQIGFQEMIRQGVDEYIQNHQIKE